MNYERLWGNLKIVFGTLSRMSDAQEGFALKALELMEKLEEDERKAKGVNHG
jgi:hypothetical protein